MSTDSDVIIANPISNAGDESIENLDYPPAMATQPIEVPEPIEDEDVDDELDEDAELYHCGAEFVGSLIQDVLDEEDLDYGEAHEVVEAPHATILEGDENEEQDDDACIHEITVEDCFADHEGHMKKHAVANLLLSALDDGRLEAAITAAPQKPKVEVQNTKSLQSVLLDGLDSGRLKETLMAQNTKSLQSVLVDGLDSGRLKEALMANQKKEETPQDKAKAVLVAGLQNGLLEASISKVLKQESQLAALQARARNAFVHGLEDGSIEGAFSTAMKAHRGSQEAAKSPHQKTQELLLDALDDSSLEAAIAQVQQQKECAKESTQQEVPTLSMRNKTRDILSAALDDGSLQTAIDKVSKVEQKPEPKPEEEPQDLPKFRVRPAFRPENTHIFEMMCNMLDCSLEGMGRSMFPEPEEELDEVVLPSAASLAPCTHKPFARKLLPTGPSAPVPAEPFPMDCLPPLEQNTFSGVLSGLRALPDPRPSGFDRLCCRSSGHVVQGVQWFTPCQSGQQMPKEEALPCPELLPEKKTLEQNDAAKRIQMAFREHAAHAAHARYFAEVKKMQQLAAQLAAPSAPIAPVASGEQKELTPMAPAAPKSPRRARRPRPSTMQEPCEGVTASANDAKQALTMPRPPSAATPKSAPARKRRSAPDVPVKIPADMQTFRMDTDTEETPSKSASKESDLAKEFMALDAQLYSLDAPLRPLTPKGGMKSPRSRGAKPASAMMLDLADDSSSMRQARMDASLTQKDHTEAVYSFNAPSLSTVAPSKRALSLGSKQAPQGGKVLPALTPRRSQALVESGNRMANQVSMASTPRGRYF
jgi:hypothetical protein